MKKMHDNIKRNKILRTNLTEDRYISVAQTGKHDRRH